MQDSKLIQLLREFSPEGFKSFRKVLLSPFFTSNPNLLKLYTYIKPNFPDFDHPRLEKEKVFKKIFPTHTYSDIKFRNLRRDMVVLVEDFLILQQLKENEYERKKILSQAFYKHKLEKLLERELEKRLAILNENSFQDSDYFQEIYDIYIVRLQAIRSRDIVLRSTLLKEAADALELFYQIAKAQIESEYQNYKRITSISKKTILGLDPIKNETLQENIIYQLFQQTITLFKTQDLDFFYELKNRFTENILLLPENIRLDILTFLINFAIGQMKKDDLQFNGVVLELYKLGLEHKTLIQEGKLTDGAFINIISTGAKAREFDWVDLFILENEKYLSKTNREEVKTLGLAYLFFHKKEYMNAIDLIYQTPFQHSLYLLSARVHMLRCYFELFLVDDTYYDLLLDQSYAFEKIVSRNEIVGENRIDAYKNFSRFLRKLILKYSKGFLEKSEQNQLLKSLDQLEITMSRSWLIEKIKKEKIVQ